MTKITNKIYLSLIASLLLITPLASSTAIFVVNNQKNFLEDNLEEINLNSLNPKITNAIQMINETLLKTYLEELVSIGPRMTGTYGCEKAAEYISEKFEEVGLEINYHFWKSFGKRWHPRFYEGKNVIGTLNGTDNPDKDILIFNAHYDTVKVSPGANDDGSGVVAVLAAAYALSQFNFNRTIKFISFSGEEVGLLGSNAYAKDIYDKNVDIFAEFNADMIGYAKNTEGEKTVRVGGTEDVQWMLDSIEQINEDYSIDFTNLNRGILDPLEAHGGSDYYAFLEFGYDPIVFWQSDFDSAYFHTPEDTIEHINFSYFVNTTRLIVGALAYLADIEMEHPQIKIVSPIKGKLYFEDRILRNLKDFKTIVLDDVLICTEAEEGSSPIEKVEFYYDGKLMETDTEKPYQWRLNKYSAREHSITTIVYDSEGKTARDHLYFRYTNLIKII